MRKLLLVFVLLFSLCFISVNACSLAPAPSGFNFNVDGCENGDEQEYLFDVLFEKDGYEELYNTEIELQRFTDAWGNRPNENQHILTESLPYMSIDNDFISLIGYGVNIEESYHNDCYQSILKYGYVETDLNPYIYGDFKIIVLDMDYNIVFTSEIFHSDVLPHPSRDTYLRFEYDSESNYLEIIEEDMFIPSIDDCGMFYSNSSLYIILSLGLLIVTVGIFLCEPIILAMKKSRLSSVLISFVFAIISLGYLSNMPIFSRNEFTFSILLLLTIHFVKYVIIKFIEIRNGNEENIRKVLLILLGVYTIYPMFLYMFIELLFN